jgi:hypothetical protein
VDAVEYILDGLEAELALERELGVRAVEFDRALLASRAAPGIKPAARVERVPADRNVRVVVPADRRQPPTAKTSDSFDFVFLHDKPFSPGAAEIIAKITGALGKTADNAPAVFAPPAPAAKAYVILGFAALRKWAPGAKAEPGQWTRLADGSDALVTYSPEWFLRFGAVTPVLKAKKKQMWDDLKALQRRIMT